MPLDMRFYHLETSPLERALPQLVKAAYGQGHNILIKTSDAQQSEHLNTLLWSFSETDFLPHGSSKDGFAEKQPIFITHENDNLNNADILILTNGQAIGEDVASYAMCCDMFDGSIEDQLLSARERWKSFKDKDDIKLSYYQQNAQGAWEQKV